MGGSPATGESSTWRRRRCSSSAKRSPHWAIRTRCWPSQVQGLARVTVRVLKRFDEAAGGGDVLHQIAGLEPDGYTRVGAALRHVTAGLVRQPVRHRCCFSSPTGGQNDVDEYEGRYGIEDTRMAVAEARRQAVPTSSASRWTEKPPGTAPRIFDRGFEVLSRVERFPSVLTTLLRDLVRG